MGKLILIIYYVSLKWFKIYNFDWFYPDILFFFFFFYNKDYGDYALRGLNLHTPYLRETGIPFKLQHSMVPQVNSRWYGFLVKMWFTCINCLQVFFFFFFFFRIWKFKMCTKHPWTFRLQFTNYQFKLNVKQLMCGIWT